MNVEKRIKTNENLPQERRTIIHMMLVNNTINEHIALALKPFDISIQQFNVLRILRGRQGEPTTLNLLQERMINEMSNTTRLVDKLVSKALVKKQKNTTNKRKVNISITKEGLQLLNNIDELADTSEILLIGIAEYIESKMGEQR